MVIVKENGIMVSKGETFQTLFEMDEQGYKLTGTETIRFSVKQRPSDDDVLLMLPCGIDALNNVISVYGTKEQMSVLEEGNYFYDIVMNLTTGARYTLIIPSPFIVKGVCYE